MEKNLQNEYLKEKSPYFKGKISMKKSSWRIFKSLEHIFKWKISRTNGGLLSPSIFSSGRNIKLTIQHSALIQDCKMSQTRGIGQVCPILFNE